MERKNIEVAWAGIRASGVMDNPEAMLEIACELYAEAMERTESTESIADMIIKCKGIKRLFERVKEDYGIFGVDSYNSIREFQMKEKKFFEMFPAREIEKAEREGALDEYYTEASGLKFFCMKEKGANNEDTEV